MTESSTNHTAYPVLDKRANQLLKTLIELFIRDGQPVGSRILSQDSGMLLSSATVRNVMADLEEMGLVTSPHTSAGRVPTKLGFRLFVDTLLDVQSLQTQEIDALKQQLNPELDAKSLLKTASSLLSDITQLAGLVMVPKPGVKTIKHLEFLPLSERRVLAVLVMTGNEIENRIIRTDRDYKANELQYVANYINTHLIGNELSEISAQLRRELSTAQQELSDLMKWVIEMSSKVFDDAVEDEEELLVDGQTHLMGVSELSDMDKLKQLFEAFQKKRDILHILDRCQAAEGVQIFIGQESGYDLLDDYSVVTAPYSTRDQVVGVLAVVGPTRMHYQRVIPVVDITARLLSSALAQQD